jgi:acyl carrier protein
MMTVYFPHAVTGLPPLFPELVDILATVTGEGAQWSAAITPTARLESDLRLDSLELAVLGDQLRRRYGDGIDLPAYFAELDLDQLIGLSVAELAGYLAERLADGDTGSGVGRGSGVGGGTGGGQQPAAP